MLLHVVTVTASLTHAFRRLAHAGVLGSPTHAFCFICGVWLSRSVHSGEVAHACVLTYIISSKKLGSSYGQIELWWRVGWNLHNNISRKNWPWWRVVCDACMRSHIHHTSSTAQGGGGSFKNRKPIGEVGCCESGMAERIHWWTERCLISLTLSLSFSAYLPTYLSIFYVSIQLSIYLSISLSLSFICLSVYLSIYGAVSSSLMQCSVL